MKVSLDLSGLPCCGTGLGEIPLGIEPLGFGLVSRGTNFTIVKRRIKTTNDAKKLW